MIEFKLPEIGEGVIEGEIVKWLLSPGQSFVRNDALVEVMTDKATIEIPAPFDGRLQEVLANEGDVRAVGSVIAILQEGSASVPVSAPAAAPVAAAPVGSSGPVLATPAARALARESGIDLATLPVDERGRLTKSDVIAAQQRAADSALQPRAADSAHQRAAAAAPSPAPTPVVTPTTSAASKAPQPAIPSTPTTVEPPRPAPAPAQRALGVDQPDEYIPFRGMRRKIAEGLVKSFTTAVHYTYVEQIDVTKLVALREQARKSAAEQGVSLSYLPFIIKAVCHALKKFPIVNAELDDANQRIVLKKRYHIGVAAATDQGLMVPVIKDADRLSLLDIAREVKRLGEGAKTGKLSRDELTGSSFTITSLGQIGGVLATPILNYPEVGILGVHAIRKVPVVDEHDNIVIGHIMNLSVALDHRIVDGFEGASFLQEVRRFLEDPTLLLLAGI